MKNKKNINTIAMILVVIVVVGLYLKQDKAGALSTEGTSQIISTSVTSDTTDTSVTTDTVDTPDIVDVPDSTDVTGAQDTPDSADEVIEENLPEENEAETVVYTSSDLKSLKNTDHFSRKLIEHIFMGTINSKGNATGYHYDGITDSPGKIIDGTKGKDDENGVYTAQIEVDGVAKISNRGMSSFYPEDMTPQEVVDAINEAYETRQEIAEDKYEGETSRGFLIQMYIDDNGRITTAFPIYED